MAIAYADGKEAISAIQLALDGIYNSMEIIQRFWEITSEQCRSGSDAQIAYGIAPGVERKVTSFSEGWEVRRKGMTQARTSILGSCDTLLIEAIGAVPLLNDIQVLASTASVRVTTSQKHSGNRLKKRRPAEKGQKNETSKGLTVSSGRIPQ